jgi:hypothetical protein
VPNIDTEGLALRAGHKPGLRISADTISAQDIAARYQSFGCSVALAHARVGRDRRPRVLIYVAPTAQAAIGLRAAEHHLLEPHISDRDRAFFTRELGLRLGFPPCCVDAFAARILRGSGHLHAGDRDRHDDDFVAASDGWVARPDWRLNSLLMRHRARLISFTPCRLDCPAALAQAALILGLVREHASASAPVLEDMLKRPLAIGPTGARVWLRRAELGADLPHVTSHVTGAEPPRELPGGAPDPDDVAHARSWSSAEIDASGHLLGCGQPAPRFLDFAALR